MKTRVNFLEGFPSGVMIAIWMEMDDGCARIQNERCIVASEDLPHQDRARLVSKAVDVAAGYKIYLALDISNDLSKSGRASRLNALQWKGACCRRRPCRERTVIWLFDSFSRFDSLMPFVGFLFSSLRRIVSYWVAGIFHRGDHTTFDLRNQTGDAQLNIANEIIDYNISRSIYFDNEK